MNYEPPAPPRKLRIRFDIYTFSHHWAARSPEYILFSILSAAAAPNSFSFLYFRDQQPLNAFRFLYVPQPLLPNPFLFLYFRDQQLLNTFVFLAFRHHGGPNASNYIHISILYEITVRESIAKQTKKGPPSTRNLVRSFGELKIVL